MLLSTQEMGEQFFLEIVWSIGRCLFPLQWAIMNIYVALLKNIVVQKTPVDPCVKAVKKQNVEKMYRGSVCQSIFVCVSSRGIGWRGASHS